MAVTDYFLKIDGIDGESKDSKHSNEIEVLAFNFGAHQTGSSRVGGGGGAGKVSMQDFHFTMRACKATPKLMLACANGEHIKNATMIARKAGKQQQEYLKIKFTDILVSSYSTGGSGHGDIPVPLDQISLNFTKIELEYKEQNADGTLGGPIPMWWNVKENQGG